MCFRVLLGSVRVFNHNFIGTAVTSDETVVSLHN